MRSGIDEEMVFDERNFKVMFAGAVGEVSQNGMQSTNLHC